MGPPTAMIPRFRAETLSVTRTDVLQQSLKKGTAREQMDLKIAKRRAGKRANLEKQLSDNTVKMNQTKKLKAQ